jgi:DNA-binding NarL/FixJ family response regulator
MNILLADDHPLFTDAIERQLSAAYPDTVVHSVENFTAALALLGRLKNIDLAVLDWDMPGMRGPSSIENLLTSYPGLKIVILSGRIDDGTVHEVLALGVKGFIPKSSPGSAIVSALSVILNGGTYIPVETALARRHKAVPAAPAADGSAKALTDREIEILKLLAGGHSNKEIARQLSVQEITIKMHASRIFSKLHVRNRVQAVSHALKAGLLGDDRRSG